MEKSSTILDNREIAFLIWLSLFFLFVIFHKDTWQAFKIVIVNLFNPKILIPIIFLILYSALIVYLFWKLHFWNLSMLKETIFWFFGIGIGMFFSIPQIEKDEKYLQNLILTNIKWLVIVEFLVNAYVLPLYLEFVLIPILVLFFGVSIYSNKKPEFKKVKTISDWFIALIGTGIFFYIITRIILDYQNFFTLNNLKLFILPIFLTIAIIPYIYIIAIYLLYESIFIRIKIRIKDEYFVQYAIRKIFKSCFLNYKKLRKISRGNFHLQLNDEDAINNAIQTIIGK